MTLLFIRYKDGHNEYYAIEKFYMEHLIDDSTIRVETEKDVLFFNYAEIENIEIVNS